MQSFSQYFMGNKRVEKKNIIKIQKEIFPLEQEEVRGGV
ncbi:MAG: hypothetical protein QG635_1277 [Bacteroidota bacterium]|nr:hypothetical protein [Bacteroidota bacterium]